MQKTDFGNLGTCLSNCNRRFRRYLVNATILAIGAAIAAFMLINLLAMRELSNHAAPPKHALTVILGVSIIDTTAGGRLHQNQMVEIEKGYIRYIGETDSKPVPANATVISGRGKYLIPGLWDAHIHTLRLSPQLHFPLLIANGVTSVRDMGDACSWSSSLDCVSDHQNWTKQIDAGVIVGPRIIQTITYHLEELPDQASELEQLISALKNRGEPFLKLQLDDQTPNAQFERMMQVAKEKGLSVAGHLPFAANLAGSSYAFASLEHDLYLLVQCSDARMTFNGKNNAKLALLAAYNKEQCAFLLADFVKKGTAYVPTHTASTGQDLRYAVGLAETDLALANQYVIAPQRWVWWLLRKAGKASFAEQKTLADMHAAALQLTLLAKQAGVKVLAGSDALDGDVVHGFGLHDELQNLVAAGLSPAEALNAATLEPARHLGLEEKLGSIAVGKMADLVLLDANPLDDIRNTRRINTVFSDGRVYDQAAIDSALGYVANQSQSLTVTSRFLRGIWYSPPNKAIASPQQ